MCIRDRQLLDPEEYPTTSTPKIQVADDLLICAMTAGSGPGALVEQSELMNMKCQAGIQIWSLKEDPENPKYLGYWDCGVPHSIGVHRFMYNGCLLYTSPSPRDGLLSRMPSSA